MDLKPVPESLPEKDHRRARKINGPAVLKHPGPRHNRLRSAMQSDSIKPVEYRDVVGFPGYRVGDDGSVWTRRFYKHVKGKRGSVFFMGNRWRKMKPNIHENGYHAVNLRTKSGLSTRYVHRLVLEAFRGPCPKGKQSRHFPIRDRGVNRLNNLRWGTPKENYEDRKAHGTHQTSEKCPKTILTRESVAEIRIKYRKHSRQCGSVALGRIYKVSASAITDVVSGKTWRS